MTSGWTDVRKKGSLSAERLQEIMTRCLEIAFSTAAKRHQTMTLFIASTESFVFKLYHDGVLKPILAAFGKHCSLLRTFSQTQRNRQRSLTGGVNKPQHPGSKQEIIWIYQVCMGRCWISIYLRFIFPFPVLCPCPKKKMSGSLPAG